MFPTELIQEEIRRVEIHRATEEGNEGQSGASVNKAVDRDFETNEENCYVASGTTSGNTWLSFEIAWSSITHVDILVPSTVGRKSFEHFRYTSNLFCQ